MARYIGQLVNATPDVLDPIQRAKLREALDLYGKSLEPWARSVAGSMLAETSRRDLRAWQQMTATLGREVRREIENSPTGQLVRDAMDRAVDLITSLPREAGERVEHLAVEAISTGARPADMIEEIMRTGKVSESRAMLIARTETSRAQTEFTKARAESAGSEGYVWEAVMDANTRPSHRRMNGKFVRWSDPPTLDGLTGHPGCVPNCRCFARVIFPTR